MRFDGGTRVAVGEVIRAVAPVFTAGAACFGAYIGYRGLEKWRAETIGKRKLGCELINAPSGSLPESALEPRAALSYRSWDLRKVP
jgi:hypothetical protein